MASLRERVLEVDGGTLHVVPDLAPLAGHGGGVQPHVLLALPALHEPTQFPCSDAARSLIRKLRSQNGSILMTGHPSDLNSKIFDLIIYQK